MNMFGKKLLIKTAIFLVFPFLAGCSGVIDPSKKLDISFYSDYEGINYETPDSSKMGCDYIGSGYVVRGGAGLTMPTTNAVPNSGSTIKAYRETRQDTTGYDFNFDGWMGYYTIKKETIETNYHVYIENGYPCELIDDSDFSKGFDKATTWDSIISKREVNEAKIDHVFLFSHFKKTIKEYSVSFVDKDKNHVIFGYDGVDPITIARVKHGELLPSSVFSSPGYLAAIAPYKDIAKSYQFSHWYILEGGKETIVDPTVYEVKANTVFYAKYDEGITNKYQISFSFKNSLGETKTSSLEIDYGTNLDEKKRPSSFLEGADTYVIGGTTYTFSSWEGVNGDGNSFDRFVIGDCELTAKYKEASGLFDLSFFYYDEDGITPVFISKQSIYAGNGGVKAPSSIQKSGFALKGGDWNDEYGNPVDFSTYVVGGNASFYKNICKASTSFTNSDVTFVYDYSTSMNGYLLSSISALTSTYDVGSLTLGGSGVSFFKTGSTIEGEPFVGLNENALRYNTQIKSVELPLGVTYLGPYALSGIINMTSLVLPSGLTEIGAGAISSDAALSSLVLPSSIYKIGTMAFAYSTGINNIDLPSSLIETGDRIFFGFGSSNLINAPFAKENTPIGFSSVWDEVDMLGNKANIAYL